MVVGRVFKQLRCTERIRSDLNCPNASGRALSWLKSARSSTRAVHLPMVQGSSSMEFFSTFSFCRHVRSPSDSGSDFNRFASTSKLVKLVSTPMDSGSAVSRFPDKSSEVKFTNNPIDSGIQVYPPLLKSSASGCFPSFSAVSRMLNKFGGHLAPSNSSSAPLNGGTTAPSVLAFAAPSILPLLSNRLRPSCCVLARSPPASGSYRLLASAAEGGGDGDSRRAGRGRPCSLIVERGPLLELRRSWAPSSWAERRASTGRAAELGGEEAANFGAGGRADWALRRRSSKMRWRSSSWRTKEWRLRLTSDCVRMTLSCISCKARKTRGGTAGGHGSEKSSSSLALRLLSSSRMACLAASTSLKLGRGGMAVSSNFICATTSSTVSTSRPIAPPRALQRVHMPEPNPMSPRSCTFFLVLCLRLASLRARRLCLSPSGPMRRGFLSASEEEKHGSDTLHENQSLWIWILFPPGGGGSSLGATDEL
ncbi:hypothetical protein Mapa_001946 [Marchantia paleacea]|nr:hypothetical protein Mapa_001946 [Marchantia paleacea]